MLKFIFFVLAFTASNFILAEQLSATGNITRVWTYTDANPMNGGSNVLTFQLSNPFSGGCNYVWVGPGNKTFLAQIALAQAADKKVTIYYENTYGSPWGDPAVCAAISVDIRSQ